VPLLEELVAGETAGDPMSAQQWVRSSLRTVSRRLTVAGHPVSPPTVRRLLVARDYALHVNAKQVEARATHADRNEQFEYIASQRAAFTAAGLPQISVDTKKKELLGNFKNGGPAWGKEATAVNVHDFPSDAQGRAVPYGSYDLLHNRGTVYVGGSAATPAFAVDVIARWWATEGCVRFPYALHLLVLADGGGSHGCRPRCWKYQLQVQLCDPFGLTVTVCHYPPGCSKYNPIAQRLFGPISVNWAGIPLRTWDTLLHYIQDTTTESGLVVDAMLHDQPYLTGQRVSVAEMLTLNLERHTVCPTWNYTIRPHLSQAAAPILLPANPEVIL
jgi:Rhodopirellula transposase DDE domain